MSCKGSLRQVFICLSYTPPPSKRYTLYSILHVLIHKGKGGEELNQSEGEMGQRIPKLGENTNVSECTQEIGYPQSINSDKHLPQSPYTGQFI